MNKLTVFLFLASIVAVSWAFPRETNERRERLEDEEIIPKTRRGRLEVLEDKLKTRALHKELRSKRSDCSPAALAALKSYGVDVSTSHICGEGSKRWEREFNQDLRKREIHYALSRFSRNMNACCSPDCDWLLSYLEVDASVMKCVKK